MRQAIFAGLIFLAAANAAQAAPDTETIVLVRHGEKPAKGLGQLNCKGLNRALKLPAVIAKQFGKPDAIFAPDPSQLKDDDGVSYAYIRPLATIEPTAILFGLPVNTRFGFEEIDKLDKALQDPAYRNATVLVGWEHKQIVKFVRHVLRENGGEKRAVPKWAGSDFDSIYVLRIIRDGKKTDVKFEHARQGLDNLPDACPN